MGKFTDAERKKKIIETANYIITHKASTRVAANAIGVSNYTISHWMNDLLMKIDYKKYVAVQVILKNNTPKSIEDAKVLKRVLSAGKMIMEGYNVAEIATILGVTVNVVNEDLQSRLQLVSPETAKLVKEIQKQNSLNNLSLGSNMSVEGQARQNGRFKKN